MRHAAILLLTAVALMFFPPHASSVGEGPWECLWGTDCSGDVNTGTFYHSASGLTLGIPLQLRSIMDEVEFDTWSAGTSCLTENYAGAPQPCTNSALQRMGLPFVGSVFIDTCNVHVELCSRWQILTIVWRDQFEFL